VLASRGSGRRPGCFALVLEAWCLRSLAGRLAAELGDPCDRQSGGDDWTAKVRVTRDLPG